MLEIAISLFTAVVVVSIIALLTMWVIETHTGKVAAIAAAAFVLLVGAAAAGRAEGRHVIVVAVYYNEDTFVVEDDDGYRDLYDDRGDLVPGDELLVDRNNIELISQSDWLWFDVYKEGDTIASFLYAEDAAKVMKHIKEQPSG